MIYVARLGSIVMPSYDYIYGSRVIVQCKKQVNPHPWRSDPTYSKYLKIIKRGIAFSISGIK